MDFWMIDHFTHDNVEFKSVDNYQEIRRNWRSDREHIQTGWATVQIPREISAPEAAIEYTIPLLEDYSLLLSFAHNHDVFFHEYTCYEKVNDELKWKTTQRHSIRVGKATGGINIYSHGLNAFISTTMPLIKDEEYIEKTGIVRALRWYNEAVNIDVVEVKFPALWIALEILAHSFARSNPKEFILSDEKWKVVMKSSKKLFKKELNLKPEEYSRLLGTLGNLREGPITDKINYLLDNYGIGMYETEVSNFNKVRNDIVHGNKLDYDSNPEPFEIELKLERLLTKLILKILNFYDNEGVHSAIHSENLRAIG
jgi:hypothetical protein